MRKIVAVMKKLKGFGGNFPRKRQTAKGRSEATLAVPAVCLKNERGSPSVKYPAFFLAGKSLKLSNFLFDIYYAA